LIGEEQRDRIVAGFEAVQRVERFVGGGGAKNAVALGIAAAKIALDGLEHIGVVVNGEEYRFSHSRGPLGLRLNRNVKPNIQRSTQHTERLRRTKLYNMDAADVAAVISRSLDAAERGMIQGFL